jgi:hypothetical protein
MKTLDIILERKIFTETSTISDASIDGAHECFFIEDKVRDNEPKVHGKTAIPYGRYKVVVTKSTRFSKQAGHDVYLPLLLNVPGFEGVRIHTGNKPEDTEGCLLPGTEKGTNQVLNSKTAFIKLNEKINEVIKGGGEVWVTIKQGNI